MFWDRLWRLSGIGFIIFFMAATIVYGAQPELGSTADALTAFYSVDRRHVLIAAILSGMAVLDLLWFAAAIRSHAGRRWHVRGGARRRPQPAPCLAGCSCSRSASARRSPTRLPPAETMPSPWR